MVRGRLKLKEKHTNYKFILCPKGIYDFMNSSKDGPESGPRADLDNLNISRFDYQVPEPVLIKT